MRRVTSAVLATGFREFAGFGEFFSSKLDRHDKSGGGTAAGGVGGGERVRQTEARWRLQRRVGAAAAVTAAAAGTRRQKTSATGRMQMPIGENKRGLVVIY